MGSGKHRIGGAFKKSRGFKDVKSNGSSETADTGREFKTPSIRASRVANFCSGFPETYHVRRLLGYKVEISLEVVLRKVLNSLRSFRLAPMNGFTFFSELLSEITPDLVKILYSPA